jgi:hypothetical protein
MDFLVKYKSGTVEQITGTNILVRGSRGYSILHILDRGRVVYTAPTDRIEIQDCGNCLAITILDEAKYQQRRPLEPARPLDVRRCRRLPSL